MSRRSRDRIFSRLHGAGKQASTHAAAAFCLPFKKLGRNQKIDRLKGFMEAVRTEVYVVDTPNWVEPLKEILKKRELKTLLYAPQTTIGDTLKKQWPEKMPTNAVLISGPSKTADIELILAFGVHGPKELIVLILS